MTKNIRDNPCSGNDSAFFLRNKMTPLFFRPIRKPHFFENSSFYFMKTAKIPVYGNIAVYENIALSVENWIVHSDAQNTLF